jgi:hypothetical protein
MSLAASKHSKLGRGFLVVTISVAIYNIAVAEDKSKASAREGGYYWRWLCRWGRRRCIGGARLWARCPSLCDRVCVRALGADFTF